MNRVLAFVVIAVATLLGNDVSLACECGGRGVSGAEALPAYDAIFLGYAVDIKLIMTEEVVRENDFYYDDQAVVTFRVRRAWKGVNDKIITVRVPTQSTACGDIFRVGQYYLVYAHIHLDGHYLETNSCTATKEMSQAAREIVSLGEPPFQAEEKVKQ